MKNTGSVIAAIFAILVFPACSKKDHTSTQPPGTGQKDTLGHSTKLWGMTYFHGSNGLGRIYTIRGDGSDFKVVYSFDSASGIHPVGTLCKASNGKLYGMTETGGAFNDGVIFSIDPQSGQFKKVVDLDLLSTGAGSRFSHLSEGKNGKIYGANSLFIFCINPADDAFKVLYRNNIPELGAFSSVTAIDNNRMYGSSFSGKSTGEESIIFSYDLQRNELAKVFDFSPSNGFSPEQPFLYASDGNLYGLATRGGSAGQGTFFKFNPNGKAFQKIIDFDGDNNGAAPGYSRLVEYKGEIYGTTMNGGQGSKGVIFKYSLATGEYKIMQAFNLETHEKTENDFMNPGGFMLAKSELMYARGLNGLGASILRYNPADNTWKTIANIPGEEFQTDFFGLTEE